MHWTYRLFTKTWSYVSFLGIHLATIKYIQGGTFDNDLNTDQKSKYKAAYYVYGYCHISY
jgi:hypothetical protein